MTDCYDDEPVMPFGKRYKGRQLSRIPASYLRCLYADGTKKTRENPHGWLREPLRSQLREELVNRGLPFGKHQGKPLDTLPDDYLLWLTSNVDLQSPLDTLVRQVIGEHERQRARQHEERARRLGVPPSARINKSKRNC